MHHHPRARLTLEPLEARENPAAWPVVTFDALTPPALPAGWTARTDDGSAVFQTAAGVGVGGTVGVVSSATSRVSGVTAYPQVVGGDNGAAVSLKADSLVPSFVFARGANLNTSTPTYVAAVVTRGLTVQVWDVVNGVTKVTARVATPASAYFSGAWVHVSLVPTGDTVAVQVTRVDNGQYLNPQGTWQAAATNAVTVKTAVGGTTGSVGIGRGALYAGPVSLDDFSVTGPVPAPPAPPPPPPASVQQSFDTTAAGTVPAGWHDWASDATGGFITTTARAETPANGFASTGGSVTAARSWSDTVLPADVDASAAVYLDSLIPARVFVRGSGLDTAKPTYYAVSLTRGLQANLIRVVDGVETVIGSITSTAYTSGIWVRARVVAEGDHVRLMLYRPDTQQWLSPDGTWSSSPNWALDKQDTAIWTTGLAGVGRGAAVAGAVTFDDFAATAYSAASGPVVTVAPASGTSPFAGDVTFHATVNTAVTRVEFWLNNQLRSVSASAPADWTLDTTILTNGTYTLTVRAIDAAGNFGSVDYTFATNNPNADPLPLPTIPRHYPNIRVAELAYTGNPMGAFEQTLLRNSVDLVVPNTQYLATIQQTAPNTPQLIYSNVSNLYQGLLTDWLTYADKTGASRESAFYHVTQATPFTGSSPSSQPVNWFWGVYQGTGTATASATDVTSAARGGRLTNVNFGPAGEWTTIGYTEKFREMNVTLVTPAAAGWGGVWEYPTATDAAGNPTAWKTLPLLNDGTAGLKQSGTITFDPPTDWVTAAVGGSVRLYYVRFRATTGTADQAAVLKTVFGRDYVRANGTFSGVIPAFDYSADTNRDGYLNDAEYANRKAGMDARFVYESRLFYPYYGQMRFVTDPSPAPVRRWAADYHARLLASNPLADGVFMDNATGNLPFAGVSVLEPTGTYSTDSGALVTAVSRQIAPKWVLSNTAGGANTADAIAAGSAGVLEEYILRPMDATWSQVGDAANLVARRLASPGSPYVVLDTYPGDTSPTDPRTEIAGLAYYYLLADPNRTFVMFNGGYAPSTSWVNHWTQAAAVNIGTPTGGMQTVWSGIDPENAALGSRVFGRTYTNGLVLYKPLSYTAGKGTGTRDDATATVYQLGGSYRVVNADGSLGPVVTQVTLRNGEGAVLIKA
jgi:hypothetical protein